MIFKSWITIAILALIGLGLGAYWLTLPPAGVTPQGESGGLIGAVGALAGAITALGAAIFGVLGKLNDYKKAKLDLAEREIDIEKKRRGLDQA